MVRDEHNIDVLRQKAEILEKENARLLRDYSALLREHLELKGMSTEAVEVNLPHIITQTVAEAKASSSSLTRPGSEGRKKDGGQHKKKQKGHGPTPQTELPKVKETFDLDDADKTCTVCGGELEAWGADHVEVVDVVERKWVVKQCELKKYRCKCGECVETADGPPKLIKGGRYSADVGVAVAVGKFVDALPLARQVKMAKRQGAQLTTQTLWDQLWALAVALEPVCERIHKHILSLDVIGTDLTTFKLIEKGGSKKQQVWQVSSPDGVFFDIKATKKAEVGKELFVLDDKPYCGVVVADGAPELASLAKECGFNIAGCWSHARRNVLKAEKEAPGQVRQLLDLIGKLYDVDKKAARDPPKDDPRTGYRHLLDLDELRVLRDTESRAVCAEIQKWILAQSSIPGGLLQAGLHYVASRWSDLTRFLDDARIPLDNNLTEGAFLQLAIGRRNYIGARSERGLIAAARFYTVFESARVCGVDPKAYLRHVVHEQLSSGVVVLPHEWVPADG